MPYIYHVIPNLGALDEALYRNNVSYFRSVGERFFAIKNISLSFLDQEKSYFFPTFWRCCPEFFFVSWRKSDFLPSPIFSNQHSHAKSPPPVQSLFDSAFFFVVFKFNVSIAVFSWGWRSAALWQPSPPFNCRFQANRWWMTIMFDFPRNNFKKNLPKICTVCLFFAPPPKCRNFVGAKPADTQEG